MSESEIDRLKEVRRLATILVDEIEAMDDGDEVAERILTLNPLAFALQDSWADEPRGVNA